MVLSAILGMITGPPKARGENENCRSVADYLFREEALGLEAAVNQLLVPAKHDVSPLVEGGAFDQINAANITTTPRPAFLVELKPVQDVDPEIKKAVRVWTVEIIAEVLKDFFDLSICQLGSAIEATGQKGDIGVLAIPFRIRSDEPDCCAVDSPKM